MARYKRVLKTIECQYCGKLFRTNRQGRKYCSTECATNAQNVDDTICWDCKKATDGELCSWAKDFTPVEGWGATPTQIHSAYNPNEDEVGIPSYKVHKCPLFERG